MRDQFTIKAPAKINLSLRIKGVRADGYHELETFIVPLCGLADELHFQKAPVYSLSCDEKGVPADERNLITMVWRAFEEKIQEKVNYEVKLVKKIPHGAGLGGGSSDAAATLLALNAEMGAPLSLSELSAVAETFGTDIPFFLHQRPCLCEGRGEVITPYSEKARSFRAALFKPDFGVSTPLAYRRWKESVYNPTFFYKAQAGPYGEMVNDLERPVFEKFPFLGLLKNWLLAQQGVHAAMMSGSGSTLFAVLEENCDAEDLTKRAKREHDPDLFTWSGRTF